MKLLCMDRHTEQNLLLYPVEPHGLGPLDHGCCLPSWWMLCEAVFVACWIGHSFSIPWLPRVTAYLRYLDPASGVW